MNDLQQEVHVKFSIKECKCTLFKLTDFGSKNQTAIDADKYNFTLNFNFSIDEMTKIVTFVIKSILSGASEIKEELVYLDSVNKFFIDNFDQIALKSPTGQITFPNQVIVPMMSICISNLRGMYAVKLDNTIYSNVILPLIDAANFIPKNPSFVG